MTRNRFSRDLGSFLRKNISFKILLALTLLISLHSCYNEPNTIGGGLLPSDDKIGLEIDTIDVAAYTIETDNLVTNGFAYGVLGCYNDLMFGSLKAEFYTQFYQYYENDSLPNLTLRPNADSMVLELRRSKIWGDAAKTLNIKIYRLTDTLNGKINYNSLKPLSKPSIGERVDSLIKIKNVEGDGYYLKVYFKKSFANEIIGAQESILKSQKNFRNTFKGLYFTTDTITDPQGIFYTLNIPGSFNLYYRKTNSQGITLNRAYKLYLAGVSFNHMDHDFDKADPILKVKKLKISDITETTAQDTVFFLSGLGGVRGLILFKDIDNWKKKMPIAVNRAVLEFDSQDNFPQSPADSSKKSLLFYGGRGFDLKTNTSIDTPIYDKINIVKYNRSQERFKIDLTLQIQNILNGHIKKNYILLENSGFSYSYMQGTYRSGSNSKPMRLIITYSKL